MLWDGEEKKLYLVLIIFSGTKSAWVTYAWTPFYSLSMGSRMRKLCQETEGNHEEKN